MLIALAIIAIALTAVIKAASQNIRSTNYLQDKTTALWLGQLVLNEARLGLIKSTDTDEALERSSQMLGRDWYWQLSREVTPNKRIKRITVKVYPTQEEDQVPLVELESFVYEK